MSAYERIDSRSIFDGKTRDSHEARYYLASGFLEQGDTVFDVFCGSGYGKKILIPAIELSGGSYIGIDKDKPEDLDDFEFVQLDFGDQRGSSFDLKLLDHSLFDVFVGLESIEHLTDFAVKRYVDFAHKAKKWIIISTPIIKNSNPFHVQNFSEEDILKLFIREDWRHYQTFIQNGIYGVFIFKRI